MVKCYCIQRCTRIEVVVGSNPLPTVVITEFIEDLRARDDSENVLIDLLAIAPHQTSQATATKSRILVASGCTLTTVER